MQSSLIYFNKCNNKYLCAAYCLQVIFRVSKNPSNERIGINYVVKEIMNMHLICPNLPKKLFAINNNNNDIAICNTEAGY